MGIATHTEREHHLRQAVIFWAWIAAAALACLSAALANGGPLFYFDSGGYLDNGLKILRQLGLATTTDGSGGIGGTSADSIAGQAVNGSRSVVYSVISAVVGLGLGLKSIPIFHTMLVFLAVWLPVRVAIRLFRPGGSPGMLFALPIIVASTTTLPFYVAYLMPDILSGVALLVVATLTVFGRDMAVFEILVALVLGFLAVTTHLSHMGMLVLLVPLSLVMSLLISRRRWWLPPLLVALITGFGLGERLSFKKAVDVVQKSDVVYYPFLTARLVQDGPGLRYLQANCPDNKIRTCQLFEALSKSDDPMRLTASHIIFETSAELGSFRLLPTNIQQKIANQQVSFFVDVLAQYPVATVGAFLKNTFIQARKNSVRMTIPTDRMVRRLGKLSSLPPGLFKQGNFNRNPAWIDPLSVFHNVIYVISLVVIAALSVMPGQLPARLRAFAVMLMLGILVNALVCGGVSQPADRYGARVIWLLPYTATLLLLFSRWCRPGWRRHGDPNPKGN